MYILCLMLMTGTVIAQKPGYVVNSGNVAYTVTTDGTLTNPSEWADTELYQLDGDLNAIFRTKRFREIVPSEYQPLHQYFLIEFLDDTTNDAGDYLQICLAAADDGLPVGGTSPQGDCYRWDYRGHGTELLFYEGDGTAWIERSDLDIAITIEDTIGTSPASDTPHLIIEVYIFGEWLVNEAGGLNDQWIRIAVYDESNAGAGVQAWPSGSVDVPDDWGKIDYTSDVLPEFPTWIIMPLFVTATLTVIIWRKRLTKK